MARLRAHTVEVVGLLRKLGRKHEEPGWLWWTGVALVSGEGRYRSVTGSMPIARASSVGVLAVAVVGREELRELAGHHPVRRDLAQ